MPDKHQDTVRTAYSLKEASSLLGITPEAVRKRLNRGTLEGFKDENGKWQVYIPDKEPDTVRTNGRTPSGQTSGEVEALRAHIGDLSKQVDTLTKALERRDKALDQAQYILALKEQKILELEAPKEKRLSWWQRLFEKQEHKK
jgi:hypothetical protein